MGKRSRSRRETFRFIHTKEFTLDYVAERRQIMKQSIRAFDTKNNEPGMQWLGLLVNDRLVSVLVYKHIRRHKIVYLSTFGTLIEMRGRGYLIFAARIILLHFRYGSRLLDHFLSTVNQTTRKEVFLYCDAERVAFYVKRGALKMKKKKFRHKVPIKLTPTNVCMRFH